MIGEANASVRRFSESDWAMSGMEMQRRYETERGLRGSGAFLGRQQSANRRERALAALYGRVGSDGLHEMDSNHRLLEVNSSASTRSRLTISQLLFGA